MRGEIHTTREAVVALDGSIKKWIRVVNIGAIGTSGSDCPLCQLYHSRFCGTGTRNCVDCPIFDDTGMRYCEGTPFAAYSDMYFYGEGEGTSLRYHAEKFLEYLKDLRSRCIVKE